MKLFFASLLASILASSPADMPTDAAAMAIRNGQTPAALSLVASPKRTLVETLELDGGWFKFFFGPSGAPTAYNFVFNRPEYVQISITDAYCPGDSFDLFRNGSYLVTTPRVRSGDCHYWEDDPDRAFVDPRFSSTKFSLPGFFNLTISAKDSPYQGGAAFIRAESRLGTCAVTMDNLTIVSSPRVGRVHAERACRRIGAVPAHVTPANAAAIAQGLVKCGYKHAWFGRLSLVDKLPKMRLDLGCLAFSAVDMADPTVEVLPCPQLLPVVCQRA